MHEESVQLRTRLDCDSAMPFNMYKNNFFFKNTVYELGSSKAKSKGRFQCKRALSGDVSWAGVVACLN